MTFAAVEVHLCKMGLPQGLAEKPNQERVAVHAGISGEEREQGQGWAEGRRGVLGAACLGGSGGCIRADQGSLKSSFLCVQVFPSRRRLGSAGVASAVRGPSAAQPTDADAKLIDWDEAPPGGYAWL